MNPILIVALGPTGSGKGSIPDKVSNFLNLESVKFEQILIDNLVENHSHYKSEVEKFIENRINDYKKKNNHMSDKDAKQEVINNFLSTDMDDETLKFFNKVYFSTRRNHECRQETKETNVSPIVNCDSVNDAKMVSAFNNGKNIVFESTGEDFPVWLFTKYKEQIKKHNYQIVMSWSVVDICELIKRNYKRAKGSIEKFITSEYTESAPRLPDITFDTFKSKLQKIVNTFNNHADSATCKKIYDGCNIRILVFDNNDRTEHEPIFDSNSDSNKDSAMDKEKILSGYNVDTSTCSKTTGGRRKSRRTKKTKKAGKKSRKSRRKTYRRRR